MGSSIATRARRTGLPSINAVRYTYGVKFNSPMGRVLYFASALLAIGMTVFVWTYFADEPLAFKIFFSVSVLGILIYNGRLAFRGSAR